ncbi:MAG: heat-shock protein Hsp20 [Chloroflexota bacterium]
MAEEKKDRSITVLEPRSISLFQQMEREFEEMRRRMWDLFRRPFTPLTPRLLTTEISWSPTVDVYEADGKLVIEAELPGVKKEDVSVTYADGILTIEGERKEEKEVKGARYYASERFTGAFSRSFAVPEGIDPNKISAEYKDGVLKVQVPLPAEAKAQPTKIAVKG